MGWGALPALRPPSSTAGASAEHDTGQVLPPAGSKSRWARRRRHWRGPDSGSGEGGPRRPPGDPKRAVGVWGTGQPRLLSSLALLLPFLFSARLRLPGRGPRRQPSPSRQLPLAPCAPAPASSRAWRDSPGPFQGERRGKAGEAQVEGTGTPPGRGDLYVPFWKFRTQGNRGPAPLFSKSCLSVGVSTRGVGSGCVIS